MVEFKQDDIFNEDYDELDEDDEKSAAIDYSELNGQLELIVQHLEKKDKKKAVSYYLKETTIDRIKECAQRFELKDSIFLDKAINKLIDAIELRDQRIANGEADVSKQVTTQAMNQRAAQKQVITPWGRLVETTNNDEKNDYANHRTINNVNVNNENNENNTNVRNNANNANIENKANDTNVRNNASIENKANLRNNADNIDINQYKTKLINYIIENYRPDYRMLYSRFERIILDEIQIDSTMLEKIVRELNKKGEVNYYEHQNLIDLNKELFDNHGFANKNTNEYQFSDDDIFID